MLTQPPQYASKFNPLCFKFSYQKGNRMNPAVKCTCNLHFTDFSDFTYLVDGSTS